MNQDVFIWGNRERGEEVIKELEKRGATNNGCDGTWANGIYFIHKGKITWVYEKSILGNIIQRYFTEIKLSEPKEKVHFEPFDKVLVCDGYGFVWWATFFSHYDNTYDCKYCTTAERYKYCIPYTGNEHLIGKECKTEDIEKYDFE